MVAFNDDEWPAREAAFQKAKQRLECLVGMEKAKQELLQLIEVLRTQRLRDKYGLRQISIAWHTIFTGPPGTGKTTLAEIFALILYGCGLIRKPKYFKVGRGHLVQGHVGATDVAVRKLLKKAKGRVLFIDEAYSLVKDGASWDYGRDAINQLVQHIEENRADFVLVLAGYDREMEQFIEANPGLRSRMCRRISIPDYSPHELCEILEQMAWDGDYDLSPEAKARAALLFHVAWAKRKSDFGNARFVRNVFERAVERHAKRVKGHGNQAAAQTLIEDDIPTAEFSPDFDVRSIDLSMLWWQAKTPPCCKNKSIRFQIQALDGERECQCGKPVTLPWWSIDFATAGPAFEQLMKEKGATFTPAQANEPKPRPKKPLDEPKVSKRTDKRKSISTPPPTVSNQPANKPSPVSPKVTPPAYVPPAPAPSAPQTSKASSAWQIVWFFLWSPNWLSWSIQCCNDVTRPPADLPNEDGWAWIRHGWAWINSGVSPTGAMHRKLWITYRTLLWLFCLIWPAVVGLLIVSFWILAALLVFVSIVAGFAGF